MFVYCVCASILGKTDIVSVAMSLLWFGYLYVRSEYLSGLIIASLDDTKTFVGDQNKS